MPEKNMEEIEARESFVTPEGVLHFFSESGEEIKISLKAKTRVFREIQGMEELDALFHFLESVGDKKTICQIDDLAIEETAVLVTLWSDGLSKRLEDAINRRTLRQGE